YTGDIPRHVDFAIKAEIAKTFLESHGLDYAAAASDRQMPLADVVDVVGAFTVLVGCRGQPVPPPAAASSSPHGGGPSKAVLYEETPGNPNGTRYDGTAVWRIDREWSETVVHADIEVPSRRMTVTWSLRLNADKSLPASHTVRVDVALPPNDAR